MARYDFDPQDYANRTANSYRLEIDARRREEERKAALKELDEYKNPVKNATHIVENLAEREVRKSIASDPIANEFRKANMVGGLVFAVAGATALSIAAGAADAARYTAMENAREGLTAEYTREMKESYEKSEMTLADLKREASEKLESFNLEKETAYNEYKTTTEAAHARIEEATRDYDKQISALNRQEYEADRIAKEGYARVDSAYEARVAEIKSSLPESERADAIKSAERERDSAKEEISRAHETSLSTITQDRDGLLSTRDSIIESQNKVLSEAKDIYSKTVSESRREYNSAEARFNDFESNRVNLAEKETRSAIGFVASDDNSRFVMVDKKYGYDMAQIKGTAEEKEILSKYDEIQANKAIAKANGENYESKLTPAELAKVKAIEDNALNIERKYAPGKASADEVISSTNRVHTELSRSLIATLGSTADKELLDKVQADDKARAEAKKNGTPYVAAATSEERAQLKALEKNYAGSLSSAKEINATIGVLTKAGADLDAKINIQEKSFAKKQAEIAPKMSAVNEKIIANQKTLENINKASKALRTGKDENGSPLSKEKKEALEKQLKKMPSADKVRGELGVLKQEKNALGKDLKKGKAELDKLKSTKKQLDLHLANVKNKKNLLADTAIVKGKNGKGKNQESKKGKEKDKKGQRMIKKSLAPIQREVNRSIHKGNAIQKELMGTARSMSRVAQKYELALSVGAMSLKIMKMPAAFAAKCGRHAFRHIGGHTRLGAKMADKRRNRALKRTAFQENHKKLMGNLQKGKVVGKKALNKAIHTPTKLLKAPKAIVGALTDPTILAKKAALGSFRMGRKVTGVAGKGLGKVKNFTSKKMQKTKIYKKFAAKRQARFDRFKASRLGRMFGRTKQGFLGFGNKLKELKAKIAAAIASAFSAILTFVLTLLGYLLIGFALVFLIYIVVIVVSSFLSGVVAAIAGWFKNLGTETQTYIKNDPDFLMTLAVNYRNAELGILDIARSANENPSKMKVSADPLYRTITNEYQNYKSTDPDFGTSTNPKAQEILNKIISEHSKTVGKATYVYKGPTEVNASFDVANARYNSVKIKYYSQEQLETDGNGRCIAKIKSSQLSSPSSYEISNAKDAFAMVDALYSNKTETMQKAEAMAYLGVADYQTSIKGPDGKADPKANLFWLTHKVIYNSGNNAKDVWYHTTEGSGDKYWVNSSKKYTNSGTQYAYNGVCNNKTEQKLKYTITTYTDKHNSNIGTFTSDSYDAKEYNVNSAKRNNNQWKWLSSSDIYYQSGGKTSATLTSSNGSKINARVYVVKKNSSNNRSITSLHKNDRCNRLYFYRVDNWSNEFAIVDEDGYLIDFVLINNGNPFFKLLTNVQVVASNGKKYTIKNVQEIARNNSGQITGINSDYFWIDWDSKNNAYTFDVVSFENANYYADKANTKADLETNLSLGYSSTKMTNYVSHVDSRSISHVNACTHQQPHNTDYEVSYEYCRGHLDLDVAIGVICGCNTTDDKENTALFTEAMYVVGLDEDRTDYGFLGVVCYDPLNDSFGFGKSTTKAFKPKEDWAQGGIYRDAARLKTKNDYSYGVKDVEVKNTTVTHMNGLNDDGSYSSQSITCVKKLPNDTLGFAFRFDGKTFYTPNYTSGEQKNIVCYVDQGENSFSDEKTISITINRAGTPGISGLQ